jgi:hypothetical protein
VKAVDDSELIAEFRDGTWDLSLLKGRVFEVEIVSGFAKGGFSGRWVKQFAMSGRRGWNMLCGVRFGDFTFDQGAFDGYGCIKLDYNLRITSVFDYMRLSRSGGYLGAYVVAGEVCGWFRLREVVK